MKTKTLLLVASILLGFATIGCKKETGCTDVSATNYSSSAEKDDGTCTYKGKATFWNLTTSGLGNVDVYVEGVPEGTITVNYSGTPSCGASGCVTYTAPAGTYAYTAYEQGTSLSWAGTVTIASNGCTTVKLY
ncbi:MAG: hypothetical protein J0L87_12800 [Bacteroidetes bacterium]|nr:hypothetical protein [Bacteroidota bacterium]